MKKMAVLGITGPTGAGKSTILHLVEEMQGLVLDCDTVYHNLLAHSENMQKEIRQRFGPSVFGEDGQLNRKALGAIVFEDSAALEDLNRITHRYVVEEADRQIAAAAAAGYPLCALDAIALIESGLAQRCTCTIAVTAPEELRVARIMQRDGISEEYARRRIAAQKPGEWFAQRCTYTLCNDGSREQIEQTARALLLAAINKEDQDLNGREISGTAAAGYAADAEEERLGCDRQHPGGAH